MTGLATKSAGTTHEASPNPLARMTELLDPDSLVPIDGAPASGVRAVTGNITGVSVVVYATDATSADGAIGVADCRRITAALDLARLEHRPLIGLWHAAGSRLTEGTEALGAIGALLAGLARPADRSPHLAVVLGPVTGPAGYGPALADLVVMAPAGRLCVAEPDAARGEAEVPGKSSGSAHVLASGESDALARTRTLVHLLAERDSDSGAEPGGARDPRALLPADPRRPYDVKPLVRALLDTGQHGISGFTELHARWAPNVVTGLGRLAGHTIGVLATNPIRDGGRLDAAGADKAARFVRRCTDWHLPLLTLVDVAGFQSGEQAEVLHGSTGLLRAFAEATMPMVTLITRHAHGAASLAFTARGLAAGTVLAWPDADIAPLPARSVVRALHRETLAAVPVDGRTAEFVRLTEEYRRTHGDIARARHAGLIDEVIEPARTRDRLARALRGQR